jgi:hypothetical protein
MAGPRVVAVAMGNDGAIHRITGIDIKAARLAIESGSGRLQPLIGMQRHES